MNHNIIPPFMMGLDGFEVDKFPKFLDHNPTVIHHSVLLLYPQLCLPLIINVVISYLPTSMTDSGEEVQLDQHRLKTNKPERNPHDASYIYQKINRVEYKGEVRAGSDIKAKIFGLNLDPVPEIQLND